MKQIIQSFKIGEPILEEVSVSKEREEVFSQAGWRWSEIIMPLVCNIYVNI